jgi:hypothetical protein
MGDHAASPGDANTGRTSSRKSIFNMRLVKTNYLRLRLFYWQSLVDVENSHFTLCLGTVHVFER